MISQLYPPKRVLAGIERRLKEHFGIVQINQAANGRTTAAINDLEMGPVSAGVYWLGGEQDGHAVLREVTYHFLCTKPDGQEDFPVIVVEQFNINICHFLAYEGRLLMVNNPQFEWLALSLKGEVAGWMRNEEVTTLPRPQPPRPSAQTFRLMK